jgi:hypothetical protein
MDGTDLGPHSGRFHVPDDGAHGALRQGRNILAIVDGKVSDAAELVRGERTAGYRGQDPRCQRFDPLLAIRQRIADEDGLQSPRQGVVPHPEGAVFPHHGIDRPHAGNVVAPAGRATRHRNDLDPRAPEGAPAPNRRRRSAARGGDRVVDVGQQPSHARTRARLET